MLPVSIVLLTQSRCARQSWNSEYSLLGSAQCLQSNRDKYRAVIPQWFTNGTRQQYNNGEFAVDDNTNNADHIKNEKL